jgi:phage shock protein A
MSIFKRFREIFQSKMHAAADRHEEPDKILDMKFDELFKEKKRIEQGVRDSVAHRIMIQNEIEDLKKKLEKTFNQAKLHRMKALSLDEQAENDSEVMGQLERHNQEALKHLQEKMRMEERLNEFEEKYQKAELRINAMKEKQIALQAKMEQLRHRKEELKSEIRMATAEKKISSALSGLDGDFSDIDLTIQRIEDKVKRTKALAEADSEVALEGHTSNVIDIVGETADIQAELALEQLDMELLGAGQIDRLAPGKGQFFSISVSGGGTWAFPLKEKEKVLNELNEIDQEMSSLLENGQLDHDQYEEHYKRIFHLIRKRGKLIGRDIQLGVAAGEDLSLEPEIQLPPEDLEYDEALKLLEGNGSLTE